LEDTVFNKLLIAVVALGSLGLAGFGVLAWQPAMAPVLIPAPASFAPELIAKGEALAGGGYCAACHTAKGGEKFAGGYANGNPVRRDLFDQHHARSGDRHRHLVGGGVRARNA
jgi:mono/diheme cytochrome c family protein